MKYPYLEFDPQDFDSLYNTERNENQLIKFLLFGIFVAGKNSKVTAKRLDNLFYFAPTDILKNPAQWLMDMGEERFKWVCKQSGLGCYNQRWKSVVSLNEWLKTNSLQYASLGQILEIKGVGNKTARFFILFSRPYARFAVVDTHILKEINSIYGTDFTLTGSNKQYKMLEMLWLDYIEPDTPPEQNDFYARADFNGWIKHVKVGS